MKNIKLIIYCIYFSVPLYSQYFTQGYAPTVGSICLTDGTPARPNHGGHIMTGVAFSTYQDLVLVRTTRLGTFTNAAQTGGNIYHLKSSSTGEDLQSEAVKVLTLPNGNYIVVGNYTAVSGTSTLQNGVFTALFRPNGTVISVRSYRGTSSHFTVVSACNAVSTGSTLIYLYGQTDITGSGNYGVFVIAVNGSNNTQVWAQTYDIGDASLQEFPVEILASNYGGPSSLHLAGNLFDMAYGTHDVFFITVNSTNGSVIFNRRFGYDANDDQIRSVTLARTPSLGGKGFVFAGTTDFPLFSRTWILKLDSLASYVLWSRVIPIQPAKSNCVGAPKILDVTEAFDPGNTTSANYYCTGNLPGSALQLFVMKLDDMGTSMNVFKMTSSLPPNNKVLTNSVIASQANGNMIYSSQVDTITQQNNFFATKLCFNADGEACTSLNDTSILLIYSPSFPIYSIPVVTGSIGTNSLFSLSITDPVFVLPGGCTVDIAFGCSPGNRLTDELIDEQPINGIRAIWPNPVSADQSVINLQLEMEKEQQIQLRVLDLNGREILNKQFSVNKGDNQFRLELSSDLPSGMYLLQVISENRREIKRFIKE